MGPDIFFAIILLFGFLKGWSNGLVVSLFNVVGLIVGLIAALKLSSVVATWLSPSADSSKWLPVISFIIVFVAVVLLVRVGAKLVQASLELVMLGWLNRLCGALLYFLLYAMLLSVCLFYAVQLHIISAAAFRDSLAYPFLHALAPTVLNGIAKVLPFLKDIFKSLQEFFNRN